MTKAVHVLLAGGGISGLTLANLLVRANKAVKFYVTIFESRASLNSSLGHIGGGIGLWPPSQLVLQNIPNYQQFIRQFAYPMPFSSYRDVNGNILARASDNFSNQFPVQCLNRDDLISMLLDGLKNRDDVEIITSQKINGYKRANDQIIINIDDNKSYTGDLLIACDGIHSKIRNCLMSELKLPPVLETELGYTYFRANATLPVDDKHKWWSSSFETWGTYQSEKYGSHEIRFGYVPLKPPNAFWFIAIKTQENHPYLSPINGVQLINEDTKAFLQDLVEKWQPVHTESGDIAIDYKELINLTNNIIRTDIAKIKDVETFPWTSEDKRIVLLGDAAHATAPNIAQGAGLCIEDAACLASQLNRIDYLQGIPAYERERKQRAQTVQNVSDLIAKVGQVNNPLLKMLRNGIMRTAATYSPSLQRSIFKYLVSFSLGGSNKAAYWHPPRLTITDDSASSLFGKVFPDLHLLDNHIKDFKTASIGGSGTGVITIEQPSSFAKIFNFFTNLPNEMHQQPFYAEVINLSKDTQRWNRVFGYNTPQQKTYTTTHSIYCGLNRQIYLSEGVDGFLKNYFRFIYTVNIQPDKSLKYESQGITFFNAFQLQLPTFLLPKSEWIETPTAEGWKFNGKISVPILGTLLHYYGKFQATKMAIINNKRIIIAGGSGMIGKEVCLEFIKKGYDVYCLSRDANTPINLEGVKVRLIYEDWSDLIDKNTIILNLSGANPGAQRWTSAVKTDIEESRYQIIDIIINNIDKAREKPLKYLQASAVGIYGNAGDAILTEESAAVIDNEPGTNFRIKTCTEIEKRANKANCNVVNLRIGHVLSNTGGILPYYRYAGFFGASRFGSGNQFVPFIHIHDVAKAIEFIANNNTIIDGAINITAPNPCTNANMLQELQLIKSMPEIPIPASSLKLLGESSVILTDSERVQPKRLMENGFKFDYNDINESLHGLQ